MLNENANAIGMHIARFKCKRGSLSPQPSAERAQAPPTALSTSASTRRRLKAGQTVSTAAHAFLLLNSFCSSSWSSLLTAKVGCQALVLLCVGILICSRACFNQRLPCAAPPQCLHSAHARSHQSEEAHLAGAIVRFAAFQKHEKSPHTSPGKLSRAKSATLS
jgi:hypothetical protein